MSCNFLPVLLASLIASLRLTLPRLWLSLAELKDVLNRPELYDWFRGSSLSSTSGMPGGVAWKHIGCQLTEAIVVRDCQDLHWPCYGCFDYSVTGEASWVTWPCQPQSWSGILDCESGQLCCCHLYCHWHWHCYCWIGWICQEQQLPGNWNWLQCNCYWHPCPSGLSPQSARQTHLVLFNEITINLNVYLNFRATPWSFQTFHKTLVNTTANAA